MKSLFKMVLLASWFSLVKTKKLDNNLILQGKELIFSRLDLIVENFSQSPSKNLTITISTRHYEPYMYRNDGGIYYHGIEFKLLDTLAKKFNMNLSYHSQLNGCDDFSQKHK